jgi:hypothetical protein
MSAYGVTGRRVGVRGNSQALWCKREVVSSFRRVALVDGSKSRYETGVVVGSGFAV